MLLRFAPTGYPMMTSPTYERGPGGYPAVPGWGRRLRLAGKEAGDDGGSKFDTGTATKPRPRTKRPSLYRVLLLNDDYTPM